MNKKVLLLLIASLFFQFFLKAHHNAGGYFRYDCLGVSSSDPTQTEYAVELHEILELNSIPTLTPISIELFDENDILLRSEKLSVDTSFFIKSGENNPCILNRDTVRLLKVIYKDTIRISSDISHKVVYNVSCCRVDSLANISAPSGQFGMVLVGTIPAFNAVGCNSSPEFDSEPIFIYCTDTNVDGFSFSATDSDGDSLVYSFCTPFGSPLVDPDPLPPYSLLRYATGRSSADPIPALPALKIDSSTGLISGTPTVALEKYLISICIQEYRNDSLISTLTREMEITTAECNPAVSSGIEDQDRICEGFVIQFENKSNASGLDTLTYKWDFGVVTIDSDTSTLENPQFDYSPYGEGVYDVTLVINPGLACGDTVVKQFNIAPALKPEIVYDGIVCKKNNAVNFYVGGDFEPTATFEWDFGSSASIPTSTADTVLGVSFTGLSNEYLVKLTVKQGNCTEEVSVLVKLFNDPGIDFSVENNRGCYPLDVVFSNLSDTSGIAADFKWFFGDGDSSTEINPTHTYLENGFYNVMLELTASGGCVDTLMLTKDSLVVVSLDSANNQLNFVPSPAVGCLPLMVSFLDSSTFDGTARYFWDFGDGNISTQKNGINTYTDTGVYSVGLLVITEDKCIDTLIKTVDSAIRVLPVPVSNVTVSDTEKSLKEAKFTFDGSGSQFGRKSKYLINGVEKDTNIILEYQFQDTGTFEIQYIAFNEFNCSDTSSVTVLVFDEFEFIVPNVFSPNNDGINDEFEIRACGVYEYEINILDRSGESIFKSNSLNINWDGFISGRKASSGNYYYSISIKDFRGDYLNYNGNVTVIAE